MVRRDQSPTGKLAREKFYTVSCPVCAAKPGEPCKALATGKESATPHKPRRLKWRDAERSTV